MDRLRVLVTLQKSHRAARPFSFLATLLGRLGLHVAGQAVPPVLVSYPLLERLGLSDGKIYRIRLGIREAEAPVRADRTLRPHEIALPEWLAGCFHLEGPLELSISNWGSDGVQFGPLIGLLISEQKMQSVSEGHNDTIYCRYSAYAREAGALLVFLTIGGLDPSQGCVRGYVHTCRYPGRCEWTPVSTPFPALIYDRCFGVEGREEARRVRVAVAESGAGVVNHLPKITKLQAFAALGAYPHLQAYLPHTCALSESSLREALSRYDDLYLKPDALYKGKGVYRLTRSGGGWTLSHREESGNAVSFLSSEEDVWRAVDELLQPGTPYLLQEGLDLASYLGNRFDFRSLVQKDAQGEWAVAGLVARIAPTGGVITSPRSGGQVASAETVLRHAFEERWESVLAGLNQVSLEIASCVEAQLGLCVELGIDIGVVADGTARLIEVNGKPLRVSLERLKDPAVSTRINRFPIHFLAGRDLPGPGAPEAVPTASRPRVGVLLRDQTIELLPTEGGTRYRQMALEAEAAGVRALFFSTSGVDEESGMVEGWTEHKGTWQLARHSPPDVIYHRATYPDHDKRKHAAMLLRRMFVEFETVLLNGANAFSKSEVVEALNFFRDTAALAPETIAFADQAGLEQMLARHKAVFVKADNGSHGTDVLRVRRQPMGWQVEGMFAASPVDQRFGSLGQLSAFLLMLRGGRPWVLQQGIELPEADGRNFDVRVIVQKDGSGDWQVPLVLVRLAAPNRVAANMSQAAEPFLPGEFLTRFGNRFNGTVSISDVAAEAAVRTARVLESRFGQLGEVGVDIGLDRSGRPWVFEANSKPLHPELPDLPVPLVRYPFQYAAYLAERAEMGRRSGLTEPQTIE